MEQETETLSFTIGSLKLPVIVTASTKELYLNAEKRANNILASYKSRYPNRGAELLLSLTVMQLAVDLEDSLKKHADKDQTTDGLVSRVEDFLANIDKKEDE